MKTPTLHLEEPTVTVVGVGYVGLPLAVAAAGAGYRAYGLDLAPVRIASVNAGSSPVDTVTDDQLGEVGHRLVATLDPSCISRSSHVVICVPTWATVDGPPDIAALLDATSMVAERLRRGQCVIVESTTYPGTTDGPVRAILERTGLRAGHDFTLAYSPERIDPGNLRFDLSNTPKLVGGVTERCGEAAATFYSKFVSTVHLTRSSREAEAAKVLENTYRQVNIALVNEFAQLAHVLGFDILDTVRAAASKPFGFAPFRPGPGVGGHCIPVAPHFVGGRAREMGSVFRMAETAHEVNESMPGWIADRICSELTDRGIRPDQGRLLLLGATYKPDIGDPRNAPALRLLAELRARGARVGFHDPFVNAVLVEGSELKRVTDLDRAMSEADITVLVQRHRCYGDESLRQARVLFDTTGTVTDAVRL